MARPGPALLDPARYLFADAVSTRFADLDPNGLINKVAMAAVLTDARLHFITAANISRNSANLRFMVANVSTSYPARAHHQGGIDARIGVLPRGRSS